MIYSFKQYSYLFWIFCDASSMWARIAVVTLMSLSSYNYNRSKPNMLLDVVLSQVVGYL